MSKFRKGVLVIGLTAGLSITAANAEAAADNCQGALNAVQAKWDAMALPSLPAGPIGGIQAKATAVVTTRNGYTTSLANFQYMEIQLRSATRACQVGNAQEAMDSLALVQSRLDDIRPIH
jgi:hypothetical protein